MGWCNDIILTQEKHNSLRVVQKNQEIEKKIRENKVLTGEKKEEFLGDLKEVKWAKSKFSN